MFEFMRFAGVGALGFIVDVTSFYNKLNKIKENVEV